MKLIKILSVVLVTIFFTSCEDLLEERPYGTYSNENFFNSSKDALSGLLYAYDALNYIEYGSRFLFDVASATTDEMSSYNKPETMHRIEMFDWTFTPSNTVIEGFYKYCYISIGRSNNVIENVSVMDNISENDRNQYVGEALFLRAFNYFNLVRTYGSVPLRTKVVNDANNVRVSNADIEDIYDLIIDDLQQAIVKMKIRKMQGRADKVAAQSLLAKVYATLASSSLTGAPGYSWVANPEEMYQQAAVYSEMVLHNQSVYSLDMDLLGLYEVENHESSPEHIFMLSQKRELSGEEGNYSQMPQMFVIALPKVFVNADLNGEGKKVYPMVNNGSWSVYRTDSTFYKSFSDQDLRKRLFVSTIYTENGEVLANWSPGNINSTDQILSSFYYPFCRKYSDPQSLGTKTSANPYFIRFADVALIYAEAVGNSENGYQWINKVRGRAGMPQLQEGLSQEEFRKAVWAERKYELAFEGHRLFELRRTNRVNSEFITNKSINPDYAYFFPLPQQEQDLNQ